jgi:protein SCO1/2
MTNNKLPFITLIILIILGVFLIISKEKISHSKTHIGGKFTLINQHNKEVSLKNLKGKNTLLFFGFTNCPDICPNTLEKVTIVVNKLTKEQQKKINLVFITTDPQRDTVAQLNGYMKNFHPQYIALTGSEKTIKKTLSDYKIHSHQDSHSKMINHTALIYILDKHGKFLSHLSANAKLQEITNKIIQLI